ncbi:membrane protease family stomatin prohibitin-like protein [Lapidilactobacillus dextrinicus DSM 20335]|uniref:Membrane protease family stomatin prohibitin-like protein n=1 Tax=Lapidilactobacillus dextrinicus DSM 20335 TaxID=1423738 RepID=A0A0R2BUR3_9LACO|nr:SPFH domain-containing protein [Lapidilactobacillus dextrinicus]KRM80011.1 membrane protease family stomatin prohibitin-like protein [Lapidilactobacillus dextrinicus DSM 20335]QFG46216.1 SPFH/Band 7/PHB domain protein [Lapidilactobacillus dextrinicus]
MLGNIVLAIVIVVVAALLLWIIFSSIAIIHTGEVGIVERLGVYVKTMEPGFHIVLPIIYRITEVVNMKQIPMRVAEQEVITKDNVVVKISETLKYHITDVNAYVYKNKDSVTSMVQDTRAALRGIIGNMDLNDVLNGTEAINRALFEQLSEVTAGYGLNVDRANIDSVEVDQDIQASMNKLLRASREKEANIMQAEGLKQAAIAKAEGGKQSAILEAEGNKQTQILEAEGRAQSQRLLYEAIRDQINSVNEALVNNTDAYLQYKNLEAMEKVAEGKNNTIVMPTAALDSLGKIPAIKQLWDQSKTDDNQSTAPKKATPRKL